MIKISALVALSLAIVTLVVLRLRLLVSRTNPKPQRAETGVLIPRSEPPYVVPRVRRPHSAFPKARSE